MSSKSRNRRLTAAFVAAAATLLATAGGASATTYCVAKPGCSGTVAPAVQSALTTAAIMPGPDRIEVGPGSFYSPDGFIYLGAGADNTLELVGAGRDQTELTGGSGVDNRPALLLQGTSASKVSDLSITSANPANPAFVTAGLRIFGVAERIDVNGGPRSNGVELLKQSTLGASTVSIAGRFDGVLSADGSANVVDSSIDARHDGTAAKALGSGALTVSHSKLNGDIGVNAVQGGTVKIDNSLVLANEIGLIAFDSQGKNATLAATNVTVVGTDPSVTGAQSGSIEAGGTTHLTIENSAIAHVTNSLGRVDDNGGSASLIVRHSAYDRASAYESGPGSIDQAQANLDLTTPGFADLAGGDYNLAADSPLRDAGDPAPADGLAATDLGGKARSVDGNGDGIAAPDIGAFEFQPPSPPTPPVTPAGPPVTPPDVAPAITAASLTRRSFSVGSARTAVAARATRGTTFRLTLSEDAQVKITIGRAGRVAGTLERSSRLGANRIAFSGRIGRRALKPGRYVATLTATDASGKRSAPRTLRFTVVKG